MLVLHFVLNLIYVVKLFIFFDIWKIYVVNLFILFTFWSLLLILINSLWIHIFMDQENHQLMIHVVSSCLRFIVNDSSISFEQYPYLWTILYTDLSFWVFELYSMMMHLCAWMCLTLDQVPKAILCLHWTYCPILTQMIIVFVKRVQLIIQ